MIFKSKSCYLIQKITVSKPNNLQNFDEYCKLKMLINENKNAISDLVLFAK